MNRTDRGRDGDSDDDASDADETDDADGDADPAAGRGRSDARLGTVAFALAVLVASVIPVSRVASGGGGGSGAGWPGIGAVGALPFEVGLTDPFHLVGYAVLTVLASRAIGRGRRGLLLAAAGAVAFGLGIELVQAPIPWRSFAWRDAAVNAVGAAIGSAALVAAGGIGSGDETDPDEASRTRRSQ